MLSSWHFQPTQCSNYIHKKMVWFDNKAFSPTLQGCRAAELTYILSGIPMLFLICLLWHGERKSPKWFPTDWKISTTAWYHEKMFHGILENFVCAIFWANQNLLLVSLFPVWYLIPCSAHYCQNMERISALFPIAHQLCREGSLHKEGKNFSPIDFLLFPK